jgi:cobalt-zinc-cadmium efflux system outer membrane protein
MKAQLFITLTLIQTPALLAQREMTADDAVKIALERNANLSAASARVKAAEGLRVQAGLRPNPRVTIQSENTRIGGAVPFRYEQDTDNFGYVSQILEAGGKRQTRVDLASEKVRTSQLELVAQRTQVAARVLAAYWNAVGAQRLEAVFSESVKNLERTVQYHRDRVQEGSLPEADLIRVRLEYQQVLVQYQNARQDVRRSSALLFREMGMPEESGVLLIDDIAGLPPLGPIDVNEAVERRPDVKLAVQFAQQAQAAWRVEKASATPDPELLFGYKRTLGFNTAVAGLQVNLPIRNRNQGAIAAAVADETAATETLRATRVAARTEIQTLQAEYNQKRQLVEQMLPPMRGQAAETSAIAEAVYREGASDLLRLLDAERVRIQIETLYIRTLLEYRYAAINLQTAAGLLP